MNPENVSRILVVDDNPDIRFDFIKILSPELSHSLADLFKEQILSDKNVPEDKFPTFQIDTASQGAEGLEKVAKALKEDRPYALVFMDVRMPPGWDGIETMEHIWAIDPAIQCVLCTAFSDYSWKEIVLKFKQQFGDFFILKKPFDLIEVRQLAYALVQKWQLQKKVEFQLDHLEELVDDRTMELKKSQESLFQSELIFRQFAENINDVFWRSTPTLDKIIYVSPAFEEIWGRTREELYKDSHAWFNAIHPDDQPIVKEEFFKEMKEKNSVAIEYRIIHTDGTIRNIYDRGFQLSNHDGTPLCLLGIASDITDYKQRQESKAIINEIIELLKNSIDIRKVSIKILKIICLALNWDYGEIWLMDSSENLLRNISFWSNPDFEDIAFNKKSQSITFKPGIDMPGKIWQESRPVWISDIINHSELVRTDEAFNAGLNSAFGIPITYENKKLGVMDFFSQKIRNPNEAQTAMLEEIAMALGQLIQQKYTEEEIVYAAQHDALTGLLNRAGFEEILDKVIDKKLFSMTAVLILSIDPYGTLLRAIDYDASDNLSLLTADRICQLATENSENNENIARIAPDKFILILKDAKTVENILAYASKIYHAFQQPFFIKGKELFILPLIGISHYPQDGVNSKTLLLNANTALSLAKEQKLNNIHFFTKDLPIKVADKLLMEGDLRHAIEKNEFCLYYQPQVELKTGQIIGIEALIRWQHPVKGLLLPNHFISLAEEIGLITQIEKWVIKEVCKQISLEWTDVVIAVNISATHFNEHFNLVSFLKDVTKEMGVNPHQIEIEITESQFLSEEVFNLKTLWQLNELGFLISIDDFGTGFSSLKYFLNIPIGKIKIDKSFVDNVVKDRKSTAIVKALILLAHSLDKKVIAEGVESLEQLEFLAQANCDEIQGYFFSKPLPLNEIQALLLSKKDFIVHKN